MFALCGFESLLYSGDRTTYPHICEQLCCVELHATEIYGETGF